jgi:RNA polymerase sigma-70 factor, ECF subfamily
LKLDSNPGYIDELVRRAAGGEEAALVELFSGYRSRLWRMIRLRLDRRLQGRIDPSDVLQDAYVDVAEKLPEYALGSALPFSLWLRMVVGERLLRVHRHHLGTAMRDARREISLHPGALPEASSASLAAQLLGQLTSASRAALKAEMRLMLEEVLNAMDPIDREVIALRHFEELRNDEVASVLGLTKAAASKTGDAATRAGGKSSFSVPGRSESLRARFFGLNLQDPT